MELNKIARCEPILASPGMTVLDVIRTMASKNAGAVVVVSADEKVQGIFTECDNARRVTLAERDPRTTTVAEVMTAPVVTATTSTAIDEALSTMIRHQFGYLPVVGAENRIVGMICRRDVLLRRIGEKEAALQTLEAFASAGGPG